ncbi:MAG: hypothetical protein Q7K98_06840 [Candidatus Omnitrophota bacterium]|nr:hypothetical protein [Candidatus Omnitrophota bacterium]
MSKLDKIINTKKISWVQMRIFSHPCGFELRKFTSQTIKAEQIDTRKAENAIPDCR